MSGTANTIANLLARQANNTTGNILPADMRNLTATLQSRTAIYNVAMPEYGAVGDGASHPLSGITSFQGQNTTGWSTAQWQSVFPATTATTNELNWAAMQTAINAAVAASSGGTIYIPSGTYIMSNASSAGDGSGQLQLPNTPEYASGLGSSPQVNLLGDGIINSTLSWPSDLGSGKAGIVCSTNRLSFISAGFIRDLGLYGPARGGSGMHGIMWAGRRRLVRFQAVRFNHGIDIIGDQTRLEDLICQDCQYGMYWADATGGVVFNNLAFHRALLANNTIAGIGVAGPTPIGETAFYDLSFVQNPWGIFKDGGGYLMLDGCEFHNTQFEDNNQGLAGNSGNTGAIWNTVFYNTSFAWGPSGTGAAILRLSDFQYSCFYGLRGVNGGQWSAGTTATFTITGSATDGAFVGNVNGLNSNRGAVHVFSNTTVPLRTFNGASVTPL